MPNLIDVTRSMIRCSWALGVLGAQRTLGAVLGSEPSRAEARESFDEMAAAAEARLDAIGRNVYRSGERLQSGALDLVGDLAAAARPWAPGDLAATARRWLGKEEPPA